MLQDGLRCSDAALRIAGGVRGLKALALSASDTISALSCIPGLEKPNELNDDAEADQNFSPSVMRPELK